MNNDSLESVGLVPSGATSDSEVSSSGNAETSGSVDLEVSSPDSGESSDSSSNDGSSVSLNGYWSFTETSASAAGVSVTSNSHADLVDSVASSDSYVSAGFDRTLTRCESSDVAISSFVHSDASTATFESVHLQPESIFECASAAQSPAGDLVLSPVEDSPSSDAGSSSPEHSESGANLGWLTELNAGADLLSVDDNLLGAGWLRSLHSSSAADTLSSFDCPSEAKSDSENFGSSDALSGSTSADHSPTDASLRSVGVVVRNTLEWLGSFSPNNLSFNAFARNNVLPVTFSSLDKLWSSASQFSSEKSSVSFISYLSEDSYTTSTC